MVTDRLRTAATGFGLGYLVGYGLGRLLGDGSTGSRLGLAAGAVGGVAGWGLSGEGEPIEFDDTEPVEIEIEE